LLRQTRRIGRVRYTIGLVFFKTVTAVAATAFTVVAHTPRVSADERAALFASLLGENLDVLVPGKHSLVTFSAEDPAVALVHSTGLTALEHELGARRAGFRMRAELLVCEGERHDRRLSVDLVRRFELVQVGRRQDIPTRTVRLEVLALALEHASSDLACCRVVLARVGDVLDATQWHVRRNKVRVVADESRPLLVLGHGDWTTAEALYSLVGIVAFTLENARKSVVGLLNLTDDDGLELTTGSLKVEVGLAKSVFVMQVEVKAAITL
jgi:hypothetical protein